MIPTFHTGKGGFEVKEQIIELLKKNRTMTPKDLGRAMRIKTSREVKELSLALNELEDERLIYNDHESYVLIDGDEWMIGKIRDVSATEYAVINPDKKVYVSKNRSRMMMDKDEVLVHDSGNEPEVVHIYQRGVTNIPGVFVRTRTGMKFRSDVDLHTSFIVQNKKAWNIEPGMKAVVKVTEYTAPLKVKITNILGRENDPGVDISAILAENEVRSEFSKKVRSESEDLPERVHKKEMKGRTDLRDLPTVTIDGDSTKDFDDAVSVEKLPAGGYKLYVHIADVSHYVKEGGEIDQEAYKRGISIYVTDRVVPMLPFALSNGICSLNPDVDRLTLTCEMEFSPQGIMTDYSIYESIIHSDERTTYSKVNAFLENPESVPEYAHVGALLCDFSDLAKKLKAQTEKRGHIDFETKEPYYILDEKGMPVDIQIRERGWSEQMIEEAMIAANVATAHELHSNSLPGMFRIHEDPDPEKLQTLINMARVLGVKCDLDPYSCEPKDVARFLAAIEDPEDREILSTITVRSMQKARYSEENTGHYGLALDEYCHFTSPIRRYPDLLVHRMLKKHVIHKKNDEKTILKDEKKMENSALHLSEKEKDAVTIERAVNDLEAAKYMSSKVGQEFEGVIVGVTSFGFFVELDNTIEGMIPLRYMEDDFYVYDADTMSLTGQNNGNRFALGMPVRIRVRDVQIPKRQITFDYLETISRDHDDEAEGEEAELPVVVCDFREVTAENDTADSNSDADLPAVETPASDELPAVEEQPADELPATEEQPADELPAKEEPVLA
nr:ribonuclease R [Allobaculum mucilyticum]